MKRLMLTFCLCLLGLGLRAQTADRLPLAKCAYLYFVSGQGDNLRTMLSDEMQAALPAAALSGMFNQMTAQFGPLQSTGIYPPLPDGVRWGGTHCGALREACPEAGVCPCLPAR